MSMSFGLGANLKLGTSQKLTPQMQQAIKLLQMSSLELEQEVQIQLEKNPMLEREESGEDALDQMDNLEQLNNLNNNNKDKKTDDDGFSDYTSDTADTLDKLSEASFDDSAVDTSWDNVYTSAPNSLIGRPEEEMTSYMGSTSSSIQDHIRWQINFKNLSQIDNMIADYLIDSMDDSGFITLDIDELYSSLSTIATFYQWEEAIEREEIIAVLHIIQACEPLGVGARNLSECLSIQLNKLTDDTPYLAEAKRLLKHCHHLQSNNINALLSETGLKIDVIQPSLDLIRTLNPSPGQTYTDSQPSYGSSPESYDIPDVLVSIHNDNRELYAKDGSSPSDTQEIVWEVRLNPETLPKLRINQEYANLVKRGDDSPDNTYLKENLTDAKLFLRSIQERNQNLLKVASCIVKKQEQFLLSGAIAMQPLILKEIAEEVELHESTVSRLTTSKSMLTPQGLFPLKYFFSSSVSGTEGEVSSTAICAMIEEMVNNENPKKPLSDNAIVVNLNKQGIDIARRTVAKYRDQLNIGSSTQRKQRY